jgi:hypothetical protein
MADNYLERHYEEYEAKKAAWEKAKKLGKIRPKLTPKPTSATPQNTSNATEQSDKQL